MADCCQNTGGKTSPKMAVCPVNGQSYPRVESKTVLHHLRTPWQVELPQQAYYFCDSPDCEVVYFGEDARIFTQADLRTQVGQKSQQSDRTLCYCFGVTQRDTLNDDRARQFVIAQTRDKTCHCETHNPSGRCCLKDFAKPEQ